MHTKVSIILFFFIQAISAQFSINTQYIYKKREENYLSSILSGSLSNNLVVDSTISSEGDDSASYSSTTGAIVNTYISLLATQTSESQSTSSEDQTTSSMSASHETSTTVASTASSTSSVTTTVNEKSKNSGSLIKNQSNIVLMSLGIWIGFLFA